MKTLIVSNGAVALYKTDRREGLMTNRFIADKHDD
jgi:hypothetical protein